MPEAFSSTKGVWKILRYSVVRLNDKMFDIVNREYEENGSFRCV